MSGEAFAGICDEVLYIVGVLKGVCLCVVLFCFVFCFFCFVFFNKLFFSVFDEFYLLFEFVHKNVHLGRRIRTLEKQRLRNGHQLSPPRLLCEHWRRPTALQK